MKKIQCQSFKCQQQQDGSLISSFQEESKVNNVIELIEHLKQFSKIPDKVLNYPQHTINFVEEHGCKDNGGPKIIVQDFNLKANERVILKMQTYISNNSFVELKIFETFKKQKKNLWIVEIILSLKEEEQVYEKMEKDLEDTQNEKKCYQKNTIFSDGSVGICKRVTKIRKDRQTIKEYLLDQSICISIKHINDQGEITTTIDTLANEKVQTETIIGLKNKIIKKQITTGQGKPVYLNSIVEIENDYQEMEVQSCQNIKQTIYRRSYNQQGVEIKEEKMNDQSVITKVFKANPNYIQEITENSQFKAVKYIQEDSGLQYSYSYQQYHQSKDKIIIQTLKFRNGTQIIQQNDIQSNGTNITIRLIYLDSCGNEKNQETHYENGQQIVNIKESNGNDQQFQNYINRTFDKQLLKVEQMNIGNSKFRKAERLVKEKLQIEANTKKNLPYQYNIINNDENMFVNIEKQLQYWYQKYKKEYSSKHLIEVNYK